jgi:tetratricopeptide (TPR) repeat protein
VPTTAGVELVSLAPSETPRSKLVWTGPAALRAVRFDEDGLLALLADGVYVATVRGAAPPQWTRLVDAGPDWDLFDINGGARIVVLGARDGRLAMFRGDEPLGSWRCTAEHLEQLSLSAADQTVVTLDDRGLAARWMSPERIEQRREIHDSPPVTWAASADGSTVLMAVARGQVLAYASPRGSESPDPAPPQPRTILRPRLLGLGSEEMSLAVDAHGDHAVIRDRSTLRLVRLADLATRAHSWRDAVLAVLDKVAMSADGERIALLVRNQSGDQQRIVFRRWWLPDDTPSANDGESSTTTEPAQEHGTLRSIDFVGALIRDMAFVPQTEQLLVVRSNGQLLLVDPNAPTDQSAKESGPTAARPSRAGGNPLGPPKTQMPELWLKLDAPATAIAFSRTGAYLAAACEDNVLRLISVARREIRQRIPLNIGVSALAFNPRDDVLLVRTRDGAIHLYDPATGERIAAWSLSADTDHPLAAWVGDNADAMLLGQGKGVYEYRYAAADAVIERNRPYAREQRVARSLADVDFAGAWDAARRLFELDPRRGRYAQVTVLETALRHPNVDISPPWITTSLLDAAAYDCARVGHAAYDGERFDFARQCLRHSDELAGHALDAFSHWRLAACDYLAGAYEAAASELAAAIQQPDFDPAQAPTAALQQVAALWLTGRPAEARQVALHVGEPDTQGRRGDPVAATYAAAIARVMTGIEREDRMATIVDSLLGNVGERPLLFQEDEHFFAGELARQRGDLGGAAMRYQRCIDLARDEWPANWARFRLSQLAFAAASQPAEPGSESTVAGPAASAAQAVTP